MASLIQDMLKTPEQIRQERFEKLREGARAQAQLMGATGTTALPGLLSGLAAQELVASAADPAKMVQRGLLGAGKVVGSMGTPGTPTVTTIAADGQERTRQGTPGTRQRYQEIGSAIQQASMTPDERQAAQESAIARQAGSKDPERLRKLADQLRSVGRPDAAEKYDERALELETLQRETSAKEALMEDLVRQAKKNPEIAKLAVAYSADELTYNEVLTKLKDLGGTTFNLSSTERALYEDIAFGDDKKDIAPDEDINNKLDILSSSPNMFGFSSTDEDLGRQLLLKAAELAERHRATESGKGKTQREALDWALDAMLEQKYKKDAEKAQRKKEANTPIQVPGLKPVDPNEGILDEQLNIGGA
mgnify:CR=1 FL=1